MNWVSRRERLERRRFIPIALLATLIISGAAAPGLCSRQSEPSARIGSTLSIKLPDRISISLKQLEKYKSISVSAEENGTAVKFDGVPLRILLAELLPKYNLDEMKDWKEIARNEFVLELMGQDGYPGLVTALEVAMNKSGDRFILATHRDGKLIESGPQLVCKSDQGRARWVREVVLVRISRISAAAIKM